MNDKPIDPRLLADMQVVGPYVSYHPHASLPIHVKAIGGISFMDALDLHNQLSAAIRLAALRLAKET
jgi:hypothetical protein